MSPSEGRERGRKWGEMEARDDVGIPQLPFGYYYCSLLEHGVLRGRGANLPPTLHLYHMLQSGMQCSTAPAAQLTADRKNMHTNYCWLHFRFPQ